MLLLVRLIFAFCRHTPVPDGFSLGWTSGEAWQDVGGREERKAEHSLPFSAWELPWLRQSCSTHLSPSRFTQHPHTRAPSGGDISSDVSLRFLHFSLWLPYTFVISAFVNKSLTGEDIYRIMLHLTTNDVLE